jgi:hypothetical protein
MPTPPRRVPNGRPQSGGSACTDFHGTTRVKCLGAAYARSTGSSRHERVSARQRASPDPIAERYPPGGSSATWNAG